MSKSGTPQTCRCIFLFPLLFPFKAHQPKQGAPSNTKKRKKRKKTTSAHVQSLRFGKLLELRKDRVYNDQALDLTAKALQFHPEFPTLWGYRRELLTETGKEKPELLKLEMKLLEKDGLRKRFVLYCVKPTRVKRTLTVAGEREVALKMFESKPKEVA